MRNIFFPQLDPLIDKFLAEEDCTYDPPLKFIRPDADDEVFQIYFPFRAKEHFKRAIESGRVLPVPNFILAFHKKYDYLSYKMCIIWNKYFPNDVIQNMNVICKLLRGVPVHKVLKKRYELTLTTTRLDLVVESLRVKQLQKLNLL
ncbi:MAG: hypothetical protein FWE03_06370 [Firmicutes bacterium]|nr:hypothetical protein [Bacillota bacterium]